jgi:hypothetical protein
LRRQDAAAFRAKLDDWFLIRHSLVEVSVRQAVIERAEMNIGHQAKPLMIAGVIEDDQVIFAFARPQAAPDGLNKPDARLLSAWRRLYI